MTTLSTLGGEHIIDLTNVNITDYTTYEDYLDLQVTPQDLYYLGDQNLARQIVELKYKDKDTLDRNQYEDKKKKLVEGPKTTKKKVEKLASWGKDLSNFPLLNALAKREEYVRQGKLAVCKQ